MKHHLYCIAVFCSVHVLSVCRTKHAYVVFNDKETAAAVVNHVADNPIELDGHVLIVRHYIEPPNHVPHGI